MALTRGAERRNRARVDQVTLLLHYRKRCVITMTEEEGAESLTRLVTSMTLALRKCAMFDTIMRAAVKMTPNCSR